MNDSKKLEISVGGKTLTFETGKIARQANAAVTVRYGDTLLLSTVCSASKPAEGIDFLPLRVDYQEKFSSCGKTLGGFIKREGRPAEREILACRLIDRPLRPLFEDGYFNEVQVLSYVFSYDGTHSPEPLAICAASAALVLSDVPFIKPVGAVKVGMIDGEFIVNPTLEQQANSKLDLILAGTEDAILMIEGYADFLSEEQILASIEAGHKEIKTICSELGKWQKEIGKTKDRSSLRPLPTALKEEMQTKFSPELEKALKIKEKPERQVALDAISETVTQHFFPEGQEPAYSKVDVTFAFKKAQAKIMRTTILSENKRIDGRACDQVRPIYIEQGLLPRTHGSSLFTRGETQALAVATLGGESTGMRFESLNEDGVRRFYMQYSFPPFSVGEVGRMSGASRREIGHGKLAERALLMTMPSQETFPYAVRLESNITECNGSSSMASICGGCLAMMNAGVPIKHPIAGIAMGLILEGEKFAILSDILGAEDALGDMDFKIAGNEEGITAFQLDIKIEGITHEIMKALGGKLIFLENEDFDIPETYSKGAKIALAFKIKEQ